MAAEKSGLHQDVPVVCTVPSYPEKGTTGTSKETNTRICGVVLSIAIIVAGFVGVVYILVPAEFNGEVQTSSSYGNIDRARIDGVVTFELTGKQHEQRVSVTDGGQLVTIADDEDGFFVILDYKDGVAVVKNTTSLECYFFPIEKFPDYQTDDMESLKPIVVQSSQERPVKNIGDELFVTLVQSGVIPWKFIETTSDPKVAESCMDSTSFWLEDVADAGPASSRHKRQRNNLCYCWEFIITRDGRIFDWSWPCACPEDSGADWPVERPTW